jgi:sec-independent protein translocase protein TatC
MRAHDEQDEEDAKPFLQHLEDLRKMLIRSFIALALGMAIVAPLAPQFLHFLKQPLKLVTSNPDTFLRSIEVSGAFNMSLLIAFWGGLLLAAPFAVFFVGSFIFPGLTRREQKAVLNSSGFAVLLFLAGVFMGYRVMLPMALKVMFGLHGWMGITAEWTVSSYIVFSIQLMLAFGLALELPLLVLVLGQIGVLNSQQLREKRKIVIIVILIIAAVLTPPDVFSQLLMGIPLMLLYELCIWLIWLKERKRQEVVDAS